MSAWPLSVSLSLLTYMPFMFSVYFSLFYFFKLNFHYFFLFCLAFLVFFPSSQGDPLDRHLFAFGESGKYERMNE